MGCTEGKGKKPRAKSYVGAYITKSKKKINQTTAEEIEHIKGQRNLITHTQKGGLKPPAAAVAPPEQMISEDSPIINTRET